jgi:hypothetical protein
LAVRGTSEPVTAAISFARAHSVEQYRFEG